MMQPTTDQRDKILIVDDIPQNIQLVASFLKQEQYVIYFSKNGENALALAQAHDINLILLDIMMPGMDGFEVCKHLKADPKTAEIPIIFLTAKSATEDIIQGFKLGGVDYLTKPFKQEELLARMKTHLALKRSNDLIRQQVNEISTLNDELKQANAAKDRMFSIIGHDLRGPIGNFKTMLSFLVDNHTSMERNQLINEMELLNNNAGLTYNLLENLLFWAKSQRGEMQNIASLLDLNFLIEENMNLFKGNAKSKGISMSSNFTDNIECYADENMIMTIIRNLISNAIKFTAEHGNIEVGTRLNNNFVEISVTDSGVGIKPDDLDKIWSTDHSFTTSGTHKEKGSGLGLILCKEFAELNSGNISVQSTVGTGSTFTLQLPNNKH